MACSTIEWRSFCSSRVRELVIAFICAGFAVSISIKLGGQRRRIEGGCEVPVKTRVKVMYGSSLSKRVMNNGSSCSCSSSSSHSSSRSSFNLAPYSAV